MQACVIARWGIKVVLISECGGSRSKSELSLSLSLSPNLFGAFGMFLESRRNAKGEWTPCDNLSTSPSRHNPLIRPPFFLLSSFSSPSPSSSSSSFFSLLLNREEEEEEEEEKMPDSAQSIITTGIPFSNLPSFTEFFSRLFSVFYIFLYILFSSCVSIVNDYVIQNHRDR